MLPLLLIYIRELTFVASLALSREVVGFHISYLLLFYVLQILAAPLQASISDFYSRRKGLTYGFLCVFVGHVMLFLALLKGPIFLIISYVINGLFGNLTPIATASLLDVNFGKKPRVSMGLVVGTVMFAFLSFYWARWYFSLPVIFWAMTTLCLIAAFLSAFYFYDPRDEDDKTHETFDLWQEVRLITKMLKMKWFSTAIKGYYLVLFIWYVLYYYRIETLGPLNVVYAVTAFSGGYLAGVFSQMYVNNNDREVILFGIMFTVFITLLIGVYLLFGGKFLNTIIMLNFVFAYYYGVIDPRIYSYFSNHQQKHRLGTIFGLVDSSDNLSELSSIAIFALLPKMNVIFLTFFSVMVLLVAYEVFDMSFAFHKKKK